MTSTLTHDEPQEEANRARAGPIRVWAAKRRGIYDVDNRPRNPFTFGKDHYNTQEREIMADEKQADGNGKPEDKPTEGETILETPPPVPGDAVEADKQADVTIEETVAPEPTVKLVVQTMLRYEYRVLPLKAKSEADLDELEKLLNELGAGGFKQTSVFVGDDIGAIFMQRQVYVVNDSGDPAAALVEAEQRDNAELIDSLVSEAS